MKARSLVLFLLLSLALGLSAALGQEDLFQKGQEVFAENCADCHRLNGQGLPGTFPALDRDPFILGAPEPVIATVLQGRKGNLGQMPTWKDKLSDEQIAAVVTYIRQAWSNQTSGVTPAMVAKIRKKGK
jgi:cbb3-type cytochrome c oxidase subunit III